MSKMKSDRKPPLAKSPMRLRPRRVIRPNSTSLQTPPGSLTKSQKPIRTWAVEESEIRPEYRSISCELRALAKMVRDELGNGEPEKAGFGETSLSANSTPLFERGRFYDEYAARRNERLKRKKGGETGDDSKAGRHLGVTIESSKRRDSKKLESLRKSVSAAYSAEMNETRTPRYLLRSMSKENKKPPLAVNSDKSSVIGSERKTGTRRVKRT
ncbi:uncharacterized protein LOC110417272 [Herrania umbratica]|uniref:Uncharacterized protein LOC110417272 n=1 Tax=Herrania umbratica TaxID=108875 RepID=A0A6J1AED7_9ROSI|nr:uncharacterized protein LOC110417272 [Herrania umbratica]XP_021285206.1 uncharacterized protein LOC110417272 [Herrania umbratica]